MGNIEIEMQPTSPVALVVSNGDWKYTVKPGIYLTPTSTSTPQTRYRVDITVQALVNPLKLPVAPHGLVGQGFDGYATNGMRDSYIPEGNGEFTTAAQGEGAIEGTVDDYVVASPDPFATAFLYERFYSTVAQQRDVSKLTARRWVGQNLSTLFAIANDQPV
eukprot:CAMPEP_0119345598 /NCGR_PEP_ID=MMETSP1333-20130426/107571_1 /TAXON_ID=418940 /ORGANISM="Scyphosphaera apsteinii, Strain RCC1455" /LENGTH=161 /DNA_ID=CAMNT_0007358075 /DNA_START=830 /DNA_END=1315 /DNA_ORIENTATION=-